MKIKIKSENIFVLLSIFISTIIANLLWHSLQEIFNPLVSYILYIVAFSCLVIWNNLIKSKYTLLKETIEKKEKEEKDISYYTEIIKRIVAIKQPISILINNKEVISKTMDIVDIHSIEFILDETEIPKPIEVEDSELE